MFSPKFKYNLSRILPFGIIWLLFGVIFLVVEYAATKEYGYLPSGVIELELSILLFALIAISLVGMLIGVIELLFVHPLLVRASFLKTIIVKVLIYSLFLFAIICILYPVAASLELKTSVFDESVWSKFSEYLSSIAFLSTGFQMFISLFASLFYSEISENIGHAVLRNFISGKYHKPVEENRIFMFLDMKSSTTIAEELGHVAYFKLLKAYYNTLSKAVIEHSGEVYQYVGDEMVISWKLAKGIHDNNCIKCFFTMKKDLSERKVWFEKKFGHHPSFKAGLHFGHVTTGEIGSIKKDIIFTGDVLNATARIQSLCNTYNVDILLSGELVAQLEENNDFMFHSLGEQELRGKSKLLELYTVRRR